MHLPRHGDSIAAVSTPPRTVIGRASAEEEICTGSSKSAQHTDLQTHARVPSQLASCYASSCVAAG
eukprot:COSAG01_NODE_7150_length_3329_cov_2.649845_4_plen_66_part_00